MQMNPAYISAISALLGSTIGGLTSFFSTWLGQNVQMRAQLLLNDKTLRQQLYRDFVNAASSLFVESLMCDTPDPGKLVELYAMVSRMRVISLPEVSEEAEQVVRMIFETYTKPNKGIADIRTMVDQEDFDPMRKFAEVCRVELESLR